MWFWGLRKTENSTAQDGYSDLNFCRAADAEKRQAYLESATPAATLQWLSFRDRGKKMVLNKGMKIRRLLTGRFIRWSVLRTIMLAPTGEEEQCMIHARRSGGATGQRRVRAINGEKHHQRAGLLG